MMTKIFYMLHVIFVFAIWRNLGILNSHCICSDSVCKKLFFLSFIPPYIFADAKIICGS